jgi:hypothetical protein
MTATDSGNFLARRSQQYGQIWTERAPADGKAGIGACVQNSEIMPPMLGE